MLIFEIILKGGIACVYVGQPLDTLKVKMQSFPHLYTNPYSCLVQTYVKDGIARGLYAGTVPALVSQLYLPFFLFTVLIQIFFIFII